MVDGKCGKWMPAVVVKFQMQQFFGESSCFMISDRAQKIPPFLVMDVLEKAQEEKVKKLCLLGEFCAS